MWWWWKQERWGTISLTKSTTLFGPLRRRPPNANPTPRDRVKCLPKSSAVNEVLENEVEKELREEEEDR